MSNEEKPVCASSAYREDQLTHCTREAGHDGVHIGRVAVFMGAGEELVQWTDADAIDDTQGVDGELPDWYRVLPVGQAVRIVAIEAIDPVDGELRGCVLDDHEQPAALIVDLEETPTRRVLVPWGNVGSLGWDVEP